MAGENQPRNYFCEVCKRYVGQELQYNPTLRARACWFCEREAMANVSVKTTVDVSLKRLWGVLIAGFEGGIGYWARIEDYVEPTDTNPITFKGDRNGRTYAYADYPLNKGTAVILTDAEVKDRDCLVCMDYQNNANGDDLSYKDHTCGISVWTLDMEAIERGLKLVAEKEPRRLAEIMSEDYDAETADVFIQYCVLGEIVYG